MDEYLIDNMIPYMHNGGYDFNHMLMMPEDQLERMYPKIYYIINPIVMKQCNIMDEAYGPDYIPTREELERMIDNIMYDVEGRMKEEMPDEYEKSGMRPRSSGNPSNNPRGNPDGNHF